MVALSLLMLLQTWASQMEIGKCYARESIASAQKDGSMLVLSQTIKAHFGKGKGWSSSTPSLSSAGISTMKGAFGSYQVALTEREKMIQRIMEKGRSRSEAETNLNNALSLIILGSKKDGMWLTKSSLIYDRTNGKLYNVTSDSISSGNMVTQYCVDSARKLRSGEAIPPMEPSIEFSPMP